MVKNIFNVFKSNKRIKLSKKLSNSKYIQHEKKGLLSEEDIINQLEDEFVVGPVKLKQISQHFLFEFKKGLENEDYSLAMIPSFVTKLPSGRELGNYLSLDLGGNIMFIEVKESLINYEIIIYYIF